LHERRDENVEQNTGAADDKEGNLTEELGKKCAVGSTLGDLAHRMGDIYAVITHDFGFVSPDIVEQVKHDPDSLVPYQSSISLGVIEKMTISTTRYIPQKRLERRSSGTFSIPPLPRQRCYSQKLTARYIFRQVWEI
jgi:hypothetical protein